MRGRNYCYYYTWLTSHVISSQLNKLCCAIAVYFHLQDTKHYALVFIDSGECRPYIDVVVVYIDRSFLFGNSSVCCLIATSSRDVDNPFQHSTFNFDSTFGSTWKSLCYLKLSTYGSYCDSNWSKYFLKIIVQKFATYLHNFI